MKTFVVFNMITLCLLLSSLAFSKDATSHEEILVVSKQGNLRENPSTKSSIIGKLSIGTEVEMIEKSNNWYKIKLSDEKIGWAHRSLFDNKKTETLSDISNIHPESVVIYHSRSALIFGNFSYYFPVGGGQTDQLEIKNAIHIFYDIAGDIAIEAGVKNGAAYIFDSDAGKFRFIKDVKLDLSDRALVEEYGIDYYSNSMAVNAGPLINILRGQDKK